MPRGDGTGPPWGSGLGTGRDTLLQPELSQMWDKDGQRLG